MKISDEELLAKQELDTYFTGLCDALQMTKAEIKLAIKLIADASL